MTTGAPLFVVDAFTREPFKGNPAAVCILEREKDEAWMQSVAAEMNLSETAFVRPLESGYELRWFTPAVEVALCGHATLASAHVLWTEGIVHPGSSIAFQTRSGVLTCMKSGGEIGLDFPSNPPEEASPPEGLLDVLGIQPVFTGRAGRAALDLMLVVDSEQIVRSLAPDFRSLGEFKDVRGLMVTSRSEDPDIDFVSRFFAPRAGIDEDPVTGSAHCCLGPYWSGRLGKTRLTAFQASSRGGILRVEVREDRVVLMGEAVTVSAGSLRIP